jgi:hypothetical protein
MFGDIPLVYWIWKRMETLLQVLHLDWDAIQIGALVFQYYHNESSWNY